jgi:hypothetical protein
MQVAQYEKARRETGEPFRRADLAAGSQVKETDAEVRITALEALTTADLQIEWRRLYRTMPPTRLSRDLLIRGVAYRVQEQAHGSPPRSGRACGWAAFRRSVTQFGTGS